MPLVPSIETTVLSSVAGGCSALDKMYSTHKAGNNEMEIETKTNLHMSHLYDLTTLLNNLRTKSSLRLSSVITCFCLPVHSLAYLFAFKYIYTSQWLFKSIELAADDSKIAADGRISQR